MDDDVIEALASGEPDPRICARPLQEELRTVAAMIHLGERIPFGRDTELMERAAEHIEMLEKELLRAYDSQHRGSDRWQRQSRR